MIRLVALDLVGTLFGDDLIVSPANRAAIAAAQERGVYVTLATGRMFRSARVHAATLNITTPLICYQGALVQDPVSGEVLFHRPVAQALALEGIALLEEWELYPNVYLNDNLYTSELNPGTTYYSNLNGDLSVNLVGDLIAILRHEGADPTKLWTVLSTEDRTERTVALLRENFGEQIYAVKSNPRFAESVNPPSDKGVALAMLAERL